MAALMLRLAALFAFLAAVSADTPANCTYQEVHGRWTFWESQRTDQKHVDCSSHHGPWVRKIRVELHEPNVAVDQYGNEGTWTMVYNQGFFIHINGRSYYGNSFYKQDGEKVTSYCDRTEVGFSHDDTLRHWTCFYGQKQEEVKQKVHIDPFHSKGHLLGAPWGRTEHERLVKHVNSVAKTWRAKVHEPFVHMSAETLLKLRGGRKSWAKRPAPACATAEQKHAADQLPEEWDWRNIDGVSHVSPVRNQGSCGSCYAFSSVGMIEARLRVMSNNTIQPELSPQDIVSCSPLSQGCDGGFPFLIAGRYGQDYGLVDERCEPYLGHNSSCTRKSSCEKYYTTSYSYVGGYYGACNEALMKLALVKRGPLSVSFEVHPDFMNYKGGVYQRKGLEGLKGPEPYFEEVNHAVLLVGYGVDEASGQKYWLVKNSWGKDWGEDGYFRILRGVDEVGIESLGVEAQPIPW